MIFDREMKDAKRTYFYQISKQSLLDLIPKDNADSKLGFPRGALSYVFAFRFELGHFFTVIQRAHIVQLAQLCYRVSLLRSAVP